MLQRADVVDYCCYDRIIDCAKLNFLTSKLHFADVVVRVLFRHVNLEYFSIVHA